VFQHSSFHPLCCQPEYLDCKAVAGYEWRGSNRAGQRAWDHQAISLICQFLSGAWRLAHSQRILASRTGFPLPSMRLRALQAKISPEFVRQARQTR
jgi:hypothetical protein